MLYLLQLVQALKYENYNDIMSALDTQASSTRAGHGTSVDHTADREK